MALPPRKRKLGGRLQRVKAYFETRWRARPLPDRESWARDDLAECIVQGVWVSRCGNLLDELAKGHIHIVREVRIGTDRHGAEGQYLIFARWPDAMFIATCFRKLTPRADAAEAADAAFLQQLTPAPALIGSLGTQSAHTKESHRDRA